MKPDIEKIFEDAKAEFKQKFCREGKYFGEHGETVTSVTCSMDAHEYINFIDELKAKVIETV